MTVATVIGCLLIAFGAPLAFFLFVVARSNKLVILSIGAGFFWLVGIFVSSVFWYALVPLRDFLWIAVPLSVICSEVSRYLFWLLWTKGQNSIALVEGRITSTPSSQFTESVATGTGVGLVSSLVMYAGVLWNGFGPGILPSKSCPSLSVFFVASWLNLAWCILHIFWAVLAFRGYYRGSYRRVGAVFITHLAASLLTLLNSSAWSVPGVCAATMVPPWLLVVLLGFILNRELTPDYNQIVLKRN